MIPLTNYDFQWGRSEVVIIYPEKMHKTISGSAENYFRRFMKANHAANVLLIFFISLREFRYLFTCWVVSTIPKIRSIIMLKIIFPFLWWNSSQHLNHGPINCCSSHLISGIENVHSEFADYTVASSIWCWRSDKLCWLVSPSFKAWVVILVCQQTNIQNCPRSDTSWWQINSDGKSRELTKVYLSNVRINL